jgi:hypothetical protein
VAKEGPDVADEGPDVGARWSGCRGWGHAPRGLGSEEPAKSCSGV